MFFFDCNRKLLYFCGMIPRIVTKNIEKRILKGKAILLFGARQVGKTTLVENFLKNLNLPTLHISGDEPDVREEFALITSTQIKSFVGKNKILFIDEAQRIPNIGLTLKLITDKISNIQVIATGSSAFDMANKMNEPLTGRKYTFDLYPLSFKELVEHHGLLEEKRNLEQRLIYGSYPEVVTHPSEAKEILSLIADSYLYKDILMLDSVKKPKLLEKILKALALQIGSEVSYHEIGQLVGADKGTIEKYITLFEQTFIVFSLPSFSKNVRNELKKSKKIYFYDCGIRNAIINNFNRMGNRTDVGALWENYLIAEKMKKNHYENNRCDTFFWRTTQQQEIDFIEVKNNEITAYEFKWSKNPKFIISKTFTRAYPNAKIEKVSRKNYADILL